VELREALQKIKAEKGRASNYLQINLGYNTNILLPYKDGMVFIGSLEKAEQVETPFSSPPVVKGLDSSTIDIKVVSENEYLRYKVAQLMGVPLSEVPSLELTQAA